MASAKIVSNLKLITSGAIPTTSNLKNGELAFGVINGAAKLYGNANGTIVDLSSIAEAITNSEIDEICQTTILAAEDTPL